MVRTGFEDDVVDAKLLGSCLRTSGSSISIFNLQTLSHFDRNLFLSFQVKQGSM